jgi:ferredoxin
LGPEGTAFPVEADLTILEAALLAGVHLPSSCRNGTCRTCMCRVLEGSIIHTIDWPGLLPEEKHQGFVLPCVARPTSDVVLGTP